MKRREEGITLMVLVIMIIVLLILAGITLGSISDHNGVIEQSSKTAQDAQRESIIEKIEADLYTEKAKTGKEQSKKALKNIIEENNYGTIIEGENSFITNEGNYNISFSEITGWKSLYTQLQYIESTGTQWIDTGFISNQDSGYEIKFMASEGMTGACGIYGARTSATANSFLLAAWKDNNALFTDYNSYVSGRIRIKYDNDIHIFKANKNEIIMDGNKSITNNYTSFTSGKSSYIFKVNGGLSASKVKVYYLKVYDNNELVRDFIPILDEDDNPCLYDKVEGKYYYNQGTGEFLYGE